MPSKPIEWLIKKTWRSPTSWHEPYTFVSDRHTSSVRSVLSGSARTCHDVRGIVDAKFVRGEKALAITVRDITASIELVATGPQVGKKYNL